MKIQTKQAYKQSRYKMYPRVVLRTEHRFDAFERELETFYPCLNAEFFITCCSVSVFRVFHKA
jgi:hypothetical protein